MGLTTNTVVYPDGGNAAARHGDQGQIVILGRALRAKVSHSGGED